MRTLLLGLAAVTLVGNAAAQRRARLGPPVSTTSQLGLGFGLGVRVNAGRDVAGLVEGRFFQVPNSFVQGIEGRVNVSVAFGKPRPTELLSGTLGPALGFLSHLDGPLQGRGPLVGVRFRRD